MLREFFHAPGQRAFAWFGLAVFLGHQIFRAWLSAAINAWYGRFYDVLQMHVAEELEGKRELASGSLLEFESGVEPGSGSSGPHAFADARRQVWDQLIEFAWLVAPAVVIHPAASLIRNWWVFRWRRSLMHIYLERWNTTLPAIEGASQRVHEDTQRFAAGIHSCVTKLVNSFLTLVVFCPILLGIDMGLMWSAIGVAVGGLGISVFLGWPLVGLEVNNQKVEAQLRRQLVLLEATPHKVHRSGTPYSAFTQIFHHLTLNYRNLYLAFAVLGTWLSAFDQAAVILPYLLVAPRLFDSDPARRFSLGQLTMVTNAFSKVFDAMNIISDNWLEVNEWRSVLRRLREFEREVMSGAATPALRLVPTEMELSDAASAHADVYSVDRAAAEHSASNGSNGSGDSREP